MLVYIICLIILGIPALTMEFAIGRAAQTSPLNMYKKLEKPGQKWGGFGIICLIGNLALMAFYTVVCGWLIYYFCKFVAGRQQTLGFSLHDRKSYDQCDFPVHNGCPCLFHPVLPFTGRA